MSDTPTQTPGGVYRRLADTHRISIADVARLDQVASNPAILDAACATLARGVSVENITTALRAVGLGAAQDDAVATERLSQLRELNG
jgi:hypothetical protein